MKPVNGPQLASLARQYGTPLWTYDAAVIRERIAQLQQFDVIRFAQKACSNTHILRLMRAQGVKVDSVSLGEIERALAAGYDARGDHPGIVFTADLLDEATLAKVVEHGIPVNAGSPQMLEQLGRVSPGHRVWLRINPGFGHGHSQKTNTGGETSKHGIWFEHLAEAYALIDQYGLDLVGLHMHIGSGVDYEHLGNVCGAMIKEVKASGRDLKAISAGGGLSIPYRVGGERIDTAHYFSLWDAARKEIEAHLGHPVTLEIEPGRFLVAESGKLVAEVRAMKDVGSNHFVFCDAGFNDLMRPAMYGSYHEVSLLDADGQPKQGGERASVIAGPLCESGDVFTQGEGGTVTPRDLPAAEVGDWIVFHDGGAYGASMSSNYNTRPLIPEVLIDGSDTRLIRRRQTVAELLALESV
ncbi:diaminopimelate decarboxylase [Jeongeupia chitinilytica]|uniref:Diaminopimelate decarboxylase n=1 Tax=Jeongeupia chitinilytica TaxID=1041641 RepID=A0ABQ3GYG8_9NEIS|nr:diaminopimelate decarboxylase [Jeongeupia chitinilytica]GHD57412.1 diaminopimelate decarboxylase [Jeongeupia chitinilytica]